MNKIDKAYKILKKLGYYDLKLKEIDDCLNVSGLVNTYAEVVSVGQALAKSKFYSHIINDITYRGKTNEIIRTPSINDKALDGKHVDVLVIGGGVIGCAILRELSKYKVDALLIEKEEDLAMQASSRNDGCVHVGIDLHKGSQKLYYLQKAKPIYEELCKDLDVEYKKEGQTIAFKSKMMYPFAYLYLKHKAHANKIKGVHIYSRKKLLKIEPNLSDSIKFGAFLETGATVCPYNLTIALAENAVENHASVSLNTMVEDMVVENGEIKEVVTNRGRIYPRLVINAAGVFSDDIAKLANDRFFSIHPRKGTDFIMDKSVTPSLSKTALTVFKFKKKGKEKHTKGGGLIPTVDHNILVGPDAIETPYKEDFTTDKESMNKIFSKHKETISSLSTRDIITYFSGVRAATYEEDFVVSKGKWTKNIIHAAGIQSPGLTCAPSIALDVASWAKDMLSLEENKDFNPHHKSVVRTRELTDEERDKLIKENPKYGHIICRCEEISEGEIEDCLNSVIPPTTIDGIKRRVRAGMGRCQGGFCQPLVAKMIAKHYGYDLLSVKKKGEGRILFCDTKGGKEDE